MSETILAELDLTGSGSFTLHDTVYDWATVAGEDTPFLASLRGGVDGNTEGTIFLTLSSRWVIDYANFATDDAKDIFPETGKLNLTLVDTVSAAENADLGADDRTIGFLRMAPAHNEITLKTTGIGVLVSTGKLSTHDITLGRHSVEIMRLADGDDVVRGAEGYIGLLDLAGGDNVFTGGTGFVSTVRAFGGDDRLTLRGSAETVSLGAGRNIVDIAGDVFVASLVSYGGDNQVAVAGGAQVRSIGFSEGTDSLTVNDALIEQADLGFGDDIVTVEAGGYIVNLRQGDGENVVLVAGGGIGVLTAGDGDDVVRIDTGGIDLLTTGDGGDRVEAAIGAAPRVSLGDGDDRFVVREGGAGRDGMRLDGDGGTDTLDLTSMDADLTLDLCAAGRWQDLARGTAADGDAEGQIDAEGDGAGLGRLKLDGIEALLGGRGRDTFLGDAGDNTLDGGRNHDRLDGGAGRDILIGGQGRDDVSGGAGRDVMVGGGGRDFLAGGAGGDLFVFDARAGRDRITDFGHRTDRLHFEGLADLDDLTIRQAGDTVVITYERTRVIIEAATLAQIEARAIDLSPLDEAGLFGL